MNLSFLSSKPSLPTVEPETFTVQPEAFETGIGQLQQELKSSEENLAAVLNTLSSISKAKDFAEAIKITLDSVKKEFGWAYASYWKLNSDHSALVFMSESGTVTPEFAKVTAEASFAKGVGLSGKTWAKGELVFVEDLGEMVDCCRRESAQRAGVKSGICFPVYLNGVIAGTMDFFSLEKLEPSEDRLNTLRSIGKIISDYLTTTFNMNESNENAAAILNTLTAISSATTSETVLKATLDSVRQQFKWAYGSYWSLDKQLNALTFSTESGTVTPEFAKVTATASFAKGVGFSGKTWAKGQLMFVDDLGEMTDCCRRESAQRAGVKSGICFPIRIGGEIRGTMDFFTLEKITLSKNRLDALDGLNNIVNTALENMEKAYKQRDNLIQSLETVQGYVKDLDDDVTSVAVAVEQTNGNIQTVAGAIEEMSASLSEVSKNTAHASHMSDQASIKASETATILNQLGESARNIGKVVEIIKGIASQTNLLALNATIEAASAGDAGRGFAVVANEVKALANQSAKATEDIRNQIENIQNITESSVDATNAITKIIQDVNDINTQIASAVEEQTATIHEISNNVSEVANGSREMGQKSSQAASRSNSIADTLVELISNASKP
ncbi:MAG: methyl-accepting chemotaxis protein [Vampirovibrionales bacterium]|nr:methyl-accepting chemotaxis protein [Vampirovibrionales bacterium]